MSESNHLLDNSGRPTVRIAQCPLPNGREASLLELRNPTSRSARSGVAIILDISDSSPIADLRKLVAVLRAAMTDLSRGWPLWCYFLSNQNEISSYAWTVGDFIDGSIPLSDWIESSLLLAEGRSRGSFLRPVLAAIENRALTDQCECAFAVVLTDGELFDADANAAAPFPVFGLQAATNVSKQQHWRRVLPTSALLAVDDPELESSIAKFANPFAGRCGIQLKGGRVAESTIRVLDVKNAMLRPTVPGRIEVDMSAAPVYLLFDQPIDELADLRIECTSRRGNLTQLISPDRCEPDHLVSSAITTVLKAARAHQLLFDVSISEEPFAILWSAFSAAAELAKRGASWRDGQRAISLFDEDVFVGEIVSADRRPLYDALLCVANRDPEKESTPDTRLMIFGLRRHHRPALHWRSDGSTSLAPYSEPTEIHYDAAERRWIFQCPGSSPRKIGVRGSELLRDLSVRDAQDSLVIFSGNLT